MSGRNRRQAEGVSVTSASQLRAIVRRFDELNPYNQSIVHQLLKIESVNFDDRGQLRQLRALAISSKRYVLYRRWGGRVEIIEPKAHGLGYLYPPKDERRGPPWHAEAWGWMLPTILGTVTPERSWFDRPALMKVVVNTPNVLRKAARSIRPFNFVFYVLVDSSIGYPVGVDRDRFTLIAAFTKRREDWLALPCRNVHDGRVYQLALKQGAELDKVIPQTIGAVLRRYINHPEAKSLAPNGGRCDATTRGLLGRDRVVGGNLRLIGKEVDRRWQHGEDVSLLDSRIVQYHVRQEGARADRQLLRQIRAIGIREIIRRGGPSQHTLQKILAGRPVRPATLARLREALARESPKAPAL